MKYLVKTTEVYRVDTEDECKVLIEDAKKTSCVSKYDAVKKEKKQKGEIVEEWYKVSITKEWTSEKEPDSCIEVSYGVESAFGDE